MSLYAQPDHKTRIFGPSSRKTFTMLQVFKSENRIELLLRFDEDWSLKIPFGHFDRIIKLVFLAFSYILGCLGNGLIF